MRSEAEIKQKLSDHIKHRDQLKIKSDEYDRMNDSPSGSGQNPYKNEIYVQNSIIQTLKYVIEAV